jgi:MFS family permease
VGAAYILAEGATVPVWGKVSAIWGRRPVLLIAIVVFFIGSALSATAVSMAMLIVGWALQGLGGGGLVNLSGIVITDLFSMRYVLIWIFMID